MALTKYNYNSFDVTPVASKAMAFNSGANGLTTAAGGAMTLIKEQTASSSATISFIHGTSDVVFDSTYPIYKFVYINVHPQTDDVHFQGNFTTDGTNFNVTKTTSSFYAYHNEGDTATALAYAAAYDVAQGTGDFQFQQSAENENDHGINGEMYFFNPSSTTYVKHFMARTTAKGDEANDSYMAGYFNTTSAIDEIQFKMSSGNMDAGTIKLYGIKDS